MKVLVTGSRGHLARSVIPRLIEMGHDVTGLDLHNGDVLDVDTVTAYAHEMDACIHLAGLKYAPSAETEPIPTTQVNIMGTANIAHAFGANMILASTCKAADPETVYGCSKLVAERIALGVGGRVIRLVNVLGSPGSVTSIWKDVADGDAIPVCDATRLFIGIDQAVALFVGALTWPTGRYAPAVMEAVHMDDIAAQLYPRREQVRIPLRRGDRRRERLLAACEAATTWQPGVLRIVGSHDPMTDEEDADARSKFYCRGHRGAVPSPY